MNLTKPSNMCGPSDPLEAFKNWWIEHPTFLTPYSCPITIDNNIWGAALYRKGEYQVQLFILSPYTVIPPHCHPNVDSFEIYVSGDIAFEVAGETVLALSEHDTPAEEHYNLRMGRTVRVLPDAWHSAVSGARGGTFMSIQRWLNNVLPTNVGDDWCKQGIEARRNYIFGVPPDNTDG